jgi:hypothetical protein
MSQVLQENQVQEFKFVNNNFGRILAKKVHTGNPQNPEAIPPQLTDP